MGLPGARPQTKTTRRIAAYHEAGHAVAAFFRPACGGTSFVTIRRADLREGDAGLYLGGRALPAATRCSPDDEWLRATCVVSLAGAEVDLRLTHDELTCASADYRDVRDLLFAAIFDWEIADLTAAVTPEERRARSLEEIADAEADEVEARYKQLFDELRAEARALVGEKWPHIEAVAEVLLEREVLSGHELRAIIERVERLQSRTSGPYPTTIGS